MMDHGKDLPPLTLSNTSVSCLVTLIPVLVSMTSHGEIPSYEDETDKPAWWPSDIQWRNPKFYLQDADKKDDGLKVLRKLVYSCYSYHGAEDLCRLDKTSASDSEIESGENMEIIQLADDSEEVHDDSSAESEGPVFVCCFCLDQFNSHEQVNVHQSVCSKRFKDSSPCSQTVTLPNKTQIESMKVPAPPGDSHAGTFLGSVECPASPPDNASDFLDVIMSSSSVSMLSHYTSSGVSSDKCSKTSLTHISSSCNPLLQTSHISASSSSAAAFTSSQKRLATTSFPFVPTLKTRSQKRLDQIIEKHNLRRLMLQECLQMKEVPRRGAWWVRERRKKCSIAVQHPNSYLSQDAFTSALGLARAADVAAMVNKGSKQEQEVDLDCEIISVEGPLSAVPPPLPTPAAEKPPSTSPRSTRSLMSQLSRDSEISTRRRLSFCFVEDEWADKEALNEGRDPLQISLLTLDFSSPLGQRVKKYVRGEGHLNIIKDMESYCRTELDDDGYSKLRFRGCDYRVTYRKKRRASHYVHKYKFNKSDRLEFKTLLRTGLSSHSRHIMQSLPVCKVVLNRLTESEITFWTEEKKITISEQIIFDDDVCITQIDIPESRITQGYTPDSPSQNQLYKQAQHLAPSSPLSVGRMNVNVDTRPTFLPRISASPSHVPNIFRSRTSHTSSPPIPGSVFKPQNLTCSWRSPHLTNKVKKTVGKQECSRFNSPSLVEGISLQHKIHDKPSQNLGHLSGHKCLNPSTYSVSDRSVVGPKSNGELVSSNSRRKQQLTTVRKDDGEGGGSHSALSTNRSVVPAGHGSSNSHGGLMRNHHSDTMQKQDVHYYPSSTGQELRLPSRKLSNFDYFSIRDGKIFPVYPQNSHAVVSQHPTSTSSSSAAHPQNRQNQQLSRQVTHHPGHNHHSQSSSTVKSHSRHGDHHHHNHNNSSTSQPASGQERPSAILSSNPFQQRRLLSSNGIQEGTSCSINNNNVVNAIRPSSLNKVNTKVVPVKHVHHTFNEDDDVMEVICIDDD